MFRVLVSKSRAMLPSRAREYNLGPTVGLEYQTFGSLALQFRDLKSVPFQYPKHEARL